MTGLSQVLLVCGTLKYWPFAKRRGSFHVGSCLGGGRKPGDWKPGTGFQILQVNGNDVPMHLQTSIYKVLNLSSPMLPARGRQRQIIAK